MTTSGGTRNGCRPRRDRDFNRSYYEEVLVVRVHPELLDRQKLPKDSREPGLWKRRFREINDWGAHAHRQRNQGREAALESLEGGAAHSLSAPIDLPDHNWKFSSADVREREYWDEYQKAFSEMLTNTSTEWAPWHVIPADRKW